MTKELNSATETMRNRYNLSSIISDDKGLAQDNEKKILFQSYANLFEDDLEENLNMTSIELNSKYQTKNPSSWSEFLKYKPVKDYISGFMDEMASKKADVALVTAEEMKVGDAIRTKKMVEDKGDTEPNRNIVVMFLPQKDYKF